MYFKSVYQWPEHVFCRTLWNCLWDMGCKLSTKNKSDFPILSLRCWPQMVLSKLGFLFMSFQSQHDVWETKFDIFWYLILAILKENGKFRDFLWQTYLNKLSYKTKKFRHKMDNYYFPVKWKAVIAYGKVGHDLWISYKP